MKILSIISAALFLSLGSVWALERPEIETRTPILVRTANPAASAKDPRDERRFTEDVRGEIKQVNALIRKLETKASILGEEKKQALTGVAAKLTSKNRSSNRN